MLVRAQDSGKERDRGTGPAGPRPRSPRVPGWAAQVLALQRLAGNAAVSRALAEARHQHGPGCGHANPPVQRDADTDLHEHGPGCRHGETPAQRRVPPDEAVATLGRHAAADHGAVAYTADSLIVGVQRAAEPSAVWIQRTPGNTPAAPAAAPAPPQPQVGLPPDLNAVLGREIPDYWNDLVWNDSGRGYHTASVPQGHRVWSAVEEYTRLSQEHMPVTAPKGEATRMAESRKRLADPAITDEQRASHTRRLQEGKPGGPPPPSSAFMDIVDIVVCANPELWEKYTTNRQLYHQSLISHSERGLEASGKDRSELIPWSTGRRPNLGGAASTSVRPGFERPGQLPPGVPQDAGEAFLWHGTGTGIMDLIDEHGPAPELGRNRGTEDKPRYGVLGQGTYVADNSSKAQTYFACPRCEDPECTDVTHPPRQLMLMRGLIGSPNFAHYGNNRRGEDHKTMKDGRTSVMSPGFKKNPTLFGATGTNEFLIKDKSLLYPEIRVHYRRPAT
ncbi:hypothetical protein [Streptomyces clavuligerus]|uniref:hypothetical protein n=1 Tax=Streptomyces clavuligerus TaxID=1901 RepID=UPI00018522A7|nr:hypothetical protein [Streptomyces clavuligerus]WDN56984.1 DUF4157 domain-containing protein [Streptomyces clavuligerus]